MFQGEEVAIFLFDHYFKGIDNVGRKKAGFKMGRGAFIESLNSTAICLALTTIHFAIKKADTRWSNQSISEPAMEGK